LNALLRGGPVDGFSLVVGETAVLQGVKYVITLDTDTQLPRDSARQLVGAMAGGETGRLRTAIGLVKFFTRYAILAVAAYVIMARLRLPPLAVFAGASSLVVAVAVEAVRGIQWKS
jgi:hypothetical protein